MKEYFEKIERQLRKAYDIANEAKKKGYDPTDKVEIPLAKNMAERVEGIVSNAAPQIVGTGFVERIQELEKEYGLQDWRVAFSLSLEVAQEKFCKFEDKREAAEVGLRSGLAYLTNGVAVCPLEGFVRLKLRQRKDGREYFSLFFSGPIRAAGTTATCVFVALSDYVRKNLGYAEYDPSEKEVKRIVTELYDFHDRITNLQYLPSKEEIEFMVANLPLQIDGDPSEELEVSNYKDLNRVDTNRIRNGVCLVIGEGLTQKAAKFYAKFSKWSKDFGMERLGFFDDFVKLQEKIKAKEKTEEVTGKIMPDYTFIKDLVAGRPVLTHPLANGGFRLRYGRCRNSGFSSHALHPATLILLNNYIASGTQLKMERPCKATVISCCDSIEGPIIKLKNNSVVFIENENEAHKFLNQVSEILYLGDILVNHGDFLDRGHKLVPAGYCEEWWMQESNYNKPNISVEEAIKLCENNIPLHPRYTFHWNSISQHQFLSLLSWLKNGIIQEDEIKISYDIDADINSKRALELLGVPHEVYENNVLVKGEWCKALLFSLGNNFGYTGNKTDILEIVNEMSGAKIRDKNGTFIGSRMGRPEKAKMRKMTGTPHVLFPIGNEGGRLRCFQSALKLGKVKAQFPIYFCENCNKETIYKLCEDCGKPCQKLFYDYKLNKLTTDKKGNLSYKTKVLDINHYFNSALKILKTNHYPELIKGVRGTSNESHTPEHLVKGILRAMYKLHVNKDGTIRYDMTETPITHFKPVEINVGVEKLKELGYNTDIYGNELQDEEQILEIKPQDIILPSCPETLDEKAEDVLYNIANFIDELLVKLYKMNKFYNLNSKQDLVGQLVIAISPHTSAGIVGRIIGFSKTQCFLAHPYLHSIMRRDCDGDEACVMLLMDTLINFSLKYLPAHRGARQDEPLVLTYKLIPAEVDDMVFNMDVCWKYPLGLYRAALQYKNPWEINIEKVKERLGTEKEYFGFGFTHNTSNINNGVRCSAYKSIPTMEEKVKGQMDLATKIRAVIESDVARLVIERHFIRDIKGNLRKFSMQQFRCVDCNEKYRRPPLLGRCLNCGGRIIFTVAEGSVIKYLEPSLSLAEKYNLPTYLKQTLELTKQRIESVFGKDKEKQEGLNKWF